MLRKKKEPRHSSYKKYLMEFTFANAIGTTMQMCRLKHKKSTIINLFSINHVYSWVNVVPDHFRTIWCTFQNKIVMKILWIFCYWWHFYNSYNARSITTLTLCTDSFASVNLMKMKTKPVEHKTTYKTVPAFLPRDSDKTAVGYSDECLSFVIVLCNLMG